MHTHDGRQQTKPNSNKLPEWLRWPKIRADISKKNRWLTFNCYLCSWRRSRTFSVFDNNQIVAVIQAISIVYMEQANVFVFFCFKNRVVPSKDPFNVRQWISINATFKLKTLWFIDFIWLFKIGSNDVVVWKIRISIIDLLIYFWSG